MALRIPQDEVAPLSAIRTLPATSMDKFVSALRSAPPISNPHEMAAYVAKEIPGVPSERLSDMLRTIYTLYHIRELAGVDQVQFLDDLMEGIGEIPGAPISQKNLPKLRSVLEKLLNIEALSIVAKAARLQRDGERLYCKSKILSDIRPVFGSDPTNRPLGAVLTHTLRIGYHQGSGHEEFHVVLDSNDLEELSEVIQRAKAKDRALREFLRSAQLPSLDE